jgi:iron(III) transport system substrate-binding protein
VSSALNDNDPLRLPRIDRRMFMRGALAAGATFSAAGMLAACGGGGSTSASSGGGANSGGPAHPAYYPPDYEGIVAAAQKEKGLTVYSNMAEYNWQPIIDAFKGKYPFVEDISTNNLDSAEVFQRYYAESSSGSSPASLMVSGDPASWTAFINDHQAAADYTSPELSKLPDFGSPLRNLYTFSTDPILLAYNKALLPESQRPKGMKEFADMVRSDPGKFKNKLTTYDVANSFGFAVEYVWAHTYGGAWDVLDTILPATRMEQSSGPMVEKLTSGEYLAGFFASSTVVLPQAEKTGAILGWNYIADGTPMMFRGMAIPKTAPQSATAKLMLDFLLSHDGQVAIFKGGFTPYRGDLTKDEAPRSYSAIADQVGKDHLINVAYDKISDADAEAFRARWNGAMKG